MIQPMVKPMIRPMAGNRVRSGTAEPHILTLGGVALTLGGIALTLTK
jgi:hypothetical protein